MARAITVNITTGWRRLLEHWARLSIQTSWQLLQQRPNAHSHTRAQQYSCVSHKHCGFDDSEKYCSIQFLVDQQAAEAMRLWGKAGR
jgi:hypothetical protein